MTAKCSFYPYLLVLTLLLPAGTLAAEVVKKVGPAAKKAPAGKKAPGQAKPAAEDLARIEKIRLRLADWEKSAASLSLHGLDVKGFLAPDAVAYKAASTYLRLRKSGLPHEEAIRRLASSLPRWNDTKDRDFFCSGSPTPSTSREKNNAASSPNQRVWDMKPFSFGTPATAGSKASWPACRPISAWRP